MAVMTLLDASPSEARLLTLLALASNATYQYRTVSSARAKKVLQITEDHFEIGFVKKLYVRGALVGFFSLRPTAKPKIAELGHLFIKPEDIGKGYGTLLFQTAIDIARSENYSCLEWDSDPNAAEFYKKMGAQQIGETPCLLNPLYQSPRFCYYL